MKEKESRRPWLHNQGYWEKSDAQILYIIKDSYEAAKAMRSHGVLLADASAEGKYLDQHNDACTVLAWRRRWGYTVRGA